MERSYLRAWAPHLLGGAALAGAVYFAVAASGGPPCGRALADAEKRGPPWTDGVPPDWRLLFSVPGLSEGDAPPLPSRVAARHLFVRSLAGAERVRQWALFLSPDRTALTGRAELGTGGLCGHPGMAHGGLLASLLDDACGGLFLASGRSGFTVNLSVSYKLPVFIPAEGVRLRVDVRLDREEPSASRPGSMKVFLTAAIRSADGETVHALCTALFMTSGEGRCLIV